MLLLGVGILGAYFGVRGQDGRPPWPPRPVAPPDPEESGSSPTALRAQGPVTPPPAVFPAATKAKEPPPPLPTPVPMSTPTPTPVLAHTSRLADSIPDPVFPPLPQVPVPVDPQVKIPDPPTDKPPQEKPQPPKDHPSVGVPPAAVAPPPAVAAPLDLTRPKPPPTQPLAGNDGDDKQPSFRIVAPIRRPGQIGPGGPSLIPEQTSQQTPVATAAPSQGPAATATQTPRVTLEKLGPAQLMAGERQQYVFVVRNHGAVPARNVRIDDDLPTSLRLLAADPQPALQSDKGLTWIVPVLVPGEEHKIRCDLQASSAVSLNGVPILTVSSAAPGQTANPGHTANRVSASVLSLTVQGPVDGVPVGQAAVLEIQLANKGPQALKGLVLRVNLPPGLKHPLGSAIEGDVGDLAAGADKVQMLTTTAKLPGRHVVEVEISTTGGDKATATTEVLVQPGDAGAGLEVRQEANTRVFLQRESELKIEIANQQDMPLKNVTVLDTLPEGLEFAAASDRGLFQHDTRTAHWLIDNLAAGQTRTLTLKVQGKTAGQFPNEVVVRTEARQESKSTAKIQVEGLASLAVTVRDKGDPLEVGRPTVYEIRVVNQGTAIATGIELRASVPEGMAAGSCRGPTPFRLEGQQVVFGPLARLSPQGEAIYMVSALAQAPGHMRFLAQVSSDQERTPITREERTFVYRD
jgi:uncharacterized repeat protein (TIGR01451 family)